MWLTGRLAPDFKTIADFRRDNGVGIRDAYSAGSWGNGCSVRRPTPSGRSSDRQRFVRVLQSHQSVEVMCQRLLTRSGHTGMFPIADVRWRRRSLAGPGRRLALSVRWICGAEWFLRPTHGARSVRIEHTLNFLRVTRLGEREHYNRYGPLSGFSVSETTKSSSSSFASPLRATMPLPTRLDRTTITPYSRASINAGSTAGRARLPSPTPAWTIPLSPAATNASIGISASIFG